MKASGPVVSPIQTQHPFGDPNATQIHQRDELLRELMMRTTNERMQAPVLERDPLAPVSGEIAVPAARSWTFFAIVLLAVSVGLCLAIALS
ncbi:MAG TPA: hypothetical protein VM261_26935 [Kofleriaceae bacterium]|nr:hypothetical protein [Kofleriaceae bacterium]